MFDFIRRICSSITSKNHIDIEPQNNSKTPLLKAIDRNCDIDYIKRYLEENKTALYEFDDNYDVMCHAVSRLNYEIVEHLLNTSQVLWDYSTALFVLSNIPDTSLDEKQKDKYINIYRLIVDKNGTGIFSGYEFLNAINKKNKTLIYLMILDGVFEEQSCMSVLNKTELQIDIELNIFIKYFKRLYDNFKNLKDIKSECKTECINECKTECINECKSDCETECETECVNECKTECVNECKTECINECKSDCVNECKTQCKTECVNECKTECVNECKTECINECETECVNECKSEYETQCVNECNNGVCPIILDEEIEENSTAKDYKNEDSSEEELESNKTILVHNASEEEEIVNEELNNESKLRENVEIDVLNKILEHMKNTVANEE